MDRRQFIERTTAVGAAAPFFDPPGRVDDQVRIGVIGTGGRGRSHVRRMLNRDDTEVPAICDIDKEAINEAFGYYDRRDLERPEVYTGDDYAYRDLLERDDLDGVVIATPWLWHTPMSVDAMKAGKYVGVEVPAATTLDECWQLVKTSEATGIPCMIMENVCYRRDVMAVLNMVRKGMFGELVHLRCGYQHNIRGGKADLDHWRAVHTYKKNADLYPTHGLGPMAKCANINAGNRFLTIVSMACKSRGVNAYAREELGEDHPAADRHYQCGDIVTSQIKCANGETIIVSFDTNLPRPYSLNFRVQGTNGLWQVDGNTIYLNDRSPEHDEWEPFEKYQEKYEHPLWQRYYSQAQGSGHGGMDWYVQNAFVESIKRQVPTPIDAYDAAAWSAVTPLSEESIACGSKPVQFPDFTGGRWMEREPKFALDDSF